MTKPTAAAPTAADVRNFFRADEKRMNRLPDEARKSVQADRGRLHSKVVSTFNKGRKNPYVPGAGAAAKAADREALRKARAAQGLPENHRGRPSKAVLAAAKS